MADGKRTHNWKRMENPMFEGYLVSDAHKNRIPTAVPMLSGLIFSMAVIFTTLDVAVTPEINMADKKAEVVSVGTCCSHPSDVRL